MRALSWAHIASLVNGIGVLFHGAAISRGRGYLFLGRSGRGKSTLALLSEIAGCDVLGDDGALVVRAGTDFHIRPLPRQTYDPPADIPLGESTLLRAVFFIEQSGNCGIAAMGAFDALKRCLSEKLLLGFDTLLPRSRLRVIDGCLAVFRSVPAYRLEFRKDNSFWKVIDELEERQPVRDESVTAVST